MTVLTPEETHVLSQTFVLVLRCRYCGLVLDILTAERDFDNGNEIPLSTAVNFVSQVQFIGQLRGFVEQNWQCFGIQMNTSLAKNVKR